jgi:RNA polymerase-binding transcription factor DksA
MAKAETTTKKAASRAGAVKKAATSKKAAAKPARPAPKAAPAKKAATAKTSEPAKKAAAALKKEVAKQPAKPVKKAEASKSGATKQVAPKKETARKGAVKGEPAKKESAKQDAAKKDAAKKDAAKKEPAKQVAAKAAAKTATAKAAPAKAEPAKAEPVKKVVRKSTVICPLSGFEVKPDKPNLSPRTIDRLRTKLLEERARHVNQAEALQAEAAQLALDREEGDTQFDEEGGEGDTVSVERERDLMLSASARQIVEEIDSALERMKNKTYGLCTPAGRRISVERLEALPYADTCVDCKARAERRR